MNTQLLRYVHLQEDLGKFNGITIGYSRSDDHVFFSYSMCCKPDAYVKSVGRSVCESTYIKSIDLASDDVRNIDMDNRVGCLPLESLQDFLENSIYTQTFGDHALERMTWMDIKHSFISKMLTAYILENIGV